MSRSRRSTVSFTATSTRAGCKGLRSRGLSCLPFYALAKGFLTGKYRPGTRVESVRSAGAEAFMNARGLRVLGALDEIAGARATTVAAVALAWLASRPGVATPVASARAPEQLAALLPFAHLELTRDEVDWLAEASSS